MAKGTFLGLRSLLSGLSCALLLLPSSGCGGGNDPKVAKVGEPSGSTCPSDSALTYANFGQAFFQIHCLVCHGAKGPQAPKFDTLAEIRVAPDLIDQEAAAGPNAVNTLMPETGFVAESERRQLGEWLACGTPD
ncbi:MAG TPA: hypothetical protein VNG33_17530 [Polyangiaceae bacterium]|nr:hypothetical protein [Polyangiaceae bacterium]